MTRFFNEDPIIERRLGYTNQMMVDQLELLLRVVDNEVTITVRDGASTKEKPRYDHPVSEVVTQRIERSLLYYSQLLKEEMAAQGISFELRDYQATIAQKGKDILSQFGFVYYAMQVRTGKTFTALATLHGNERIKNVIFLTKKKAIVGIQRDVHTFDPDYAVYVTNYESMHHAPVDHWDAIIIDEAHSLGAFPKPSGRAIAVRALMQKNPDCLVILLSGTPTPESYSQMYHQVYGIPLNPFMEFQNFYRFCDKYVKVKKKKIGGMFINDYSHGLETILEAMQPYTLNYTQQEAGFEAVIDEEILFCGLSQKIVDMMDTLTRDRVLQGKAEVVLADTEVKLMSKIHQMTSGTVKFESGKNMVLDTGKAEFIRDRFKGEKIGLFYKFTAELDAIKKVFGDDLTTDISEFETTDKSIALQIVSGREGISLRHALYLVYYNIDHSATSYWQSRDRMTTIDRLVNKIYWVFSSPTGIEMDIYQVVSGKKDYTLNHFKKSFLS